MHTVICVINCFSPQNSRHVEDFKKLPDRLMQKKSMQQFFNKKKILCLCHLFRVGHKNNVSFLRLSSIRSLGESPTCSNHNESALASLPFSHVL